MERLRLASDDHVPSPRKPASLPTHVFHWVAARLRWDMAAMRQNGPESNAYYAIFAQDIEAKTSSRGTFLISPLTPSRVFQKLPWD